MSVNKVILIGHVGKDPEVKQFDNGSVANFALATNEGYKDKSGKKVEKTEWHNVVAWGKLAEIIEKYVKKGMEIYIEGKLQTRSWEDKDGNKRYVTEILANSLQMLGKSKESQKSNESREDGIGTDDLPF